MIHLASGDVYAFIRRPRNTKIGDVPCTYSHPGTCPSTCKLWQVGGCYWRNGSSGLAWNTARKISFDQLCAHIVELPSGQLWRHNVGGCLPGNDCSIDMDRLSQLALANSGKRGFTYSHKPPTQHNLEKMRKASSLGFTINLSADSLAHADRLVGLGLPVVSIVPIGWNGRATPEGNQVFKCRANSTTITCETCGLCQVSHNKRPIIALEAHGLAKKAVSRLAEETSWR